MRTSDPNTSFPIPDGYAAAPLYARNRLSVGMGNTSRDFFKIASAKTWATAFPDGQVDWEAGWRSFWRTAASNDGTGSDYRPEEGLGLDLVAFFRNSTQTSVGLIVRPPDGLDDPLFGVKVATCFENRLVRGNEVLFGIIGLATNLENRAARPCLTLFVDGPKGPSDAALMIWSALGDLGVNVGTFMRTTANKQAGVVKIVFLPEVYTKLSHSDFGIDWSMWKTCAADNPHDEWHTACLIWCDWVAHAVNVLRSKLRLMVDGAYFDCCQVIPIDASLGTRRITDHAKEIPALLQIQPEHFLFCGGKPFDEV